MVLSFISRKETSINYVTLQGAGGQRFVTNLFENLGCMVLYYKGGGGFKKSVERNSWDLNSLE
jgi:hypothetical protein